MRLQQLIYQGIVWRGLYYASVFVLNIVIARVYKASDSGVINFLINNLSFLLLLTSLSLESALGYFGSKNEINANRLTGLSLLFALLSALSAVGRVFVAPFAGLLVAKYGWTQFFITGLLISVPGMLLLLPVQRHLQKEPLQN